MADPVPFDTAAARADGVPDDQIAAFLAPKVGFDLAAAQRDGVSSTAIVDFLAPPKAAPVAQPTEAPSGFMKGVGKAAGQGLAEIPGKLVKGVGAGVVGVGAGIGAVERADRDQVRDRLDIMDRIEGGEQIKPQGPRGMAASLFDPALQFANQYAAADEKERAAIRQRTLNEIARPEPTAGERIAQSAKKVGGEIFGAGTGMNEAVERAIPLTPEEENRFSVKVTKMVTGLVPYVAAGIAGGMPALIGYGGVEAFGSTYDEAKKAGVSDEDAATAGLFSGLVQGGLMTVPVGQAMNAIKVLPNAFKGEFIKAVTEVAKSGVTLEAFSELSTIADNVVAKNTYDPTRTPLHGVGEHIPETLVAGAVLPIAGVASGRVARIAQRARPDVTKVLEAPTVDDAIAQAREAVAGTPADTEAIAAGAREFGSAQEQQQAKLLQLFGGLNAGVVERAEDGSFHYRTAEGDTIPLKVWTPTRPVEGQEQPTITPEMVRAQRTLYGKLGIDVVYFENDPRIAFDGAVDPKRPNTIFLSNDPQRNAAQVAAHEVTHVLEDTKMPDGTSLADVLHKQIMEGMTNEGWEYSARLFGMTAPERAAFREGAEGDSAHADAVVKHLVTEMGADIGGEAPKFQDFTTKVIDQVQRRYGPDAAKDVLVKLMDGLRRAMATLREFFFKPADMAEYGPPETVSQRWVTNLAEVHDTLATMYAVKFGTTAEREGAISAAMQKRGAKREVPQEGQAAPPVATAPEAPVVPARVPEPVPASAVVTPADQPAVGLGALESENVSRQDVSHGQDLLNLPRPTASAGTALLPSLQGGVHARVEENASPAGERQDEGERAQLRERLPETRAANAGTVQEVRSAESGEASPGLQPTAEGGVAVPPVPSGTPRTEGTRGVEAPLSDFDAKVQAEKDRVWDDKQLMGRVQRGIGRNEDFARDVARERVMRQEAEPDIRWAVEEGGLPADAIPSIARMYRRDNGQDPKVAFDKAVDRWITIEEAKAALAFGDADVATYDLLKSLPTDPVLEEMYARLEKHYAGSKEIPDDHDIPFGQEPTGAPEAPGAEAAPPESGRPESAEVGGEPAGGGNLPAEAPTEASLAAQEAAPTVAPSPGAPRTADVREGEDGRPALFSPRLTGESNRTYTPEERAAYERLGRAKEGVPLADRWQELKQNLGTKIIRATLDPYIGVKESDPLGYMALRNFNTTGGALEILKTAGTLKFDGRAFNELAHNGGVENMVIKPLQGEHDDWAWWVAAHRAERLSAEDREHLFTPDEISTLKKTNRGELPFDYQLSNGKTTRSREAAYADTLAKYDVFNKNVLDLTVESGLLPRDKVDALWSNPFYVPFYRQAEGDSHFVGAANSSDMVKQTAFKTLKGGTEKLHNDLWENILGNWGHMIDAAGKNFAANDVLDTASSPANGAARKVALKEHDYEMSKKEKETTTWTMVDGKKQYWEVTDPLIFDAVAALNHMGFHDPVSKAANWFSRVLRMGVTSDPRFMLRITIKDTEQAVATAPMSYNVAKNVVQGYSMTDLPGALSNVARAVAGAELHELNEAAELRQALAGGGLMRLGAGHASGMRTTTAESMSGAPVADGIAYLARVFRAYKTAMAQSEDINRVALYKTMRDQGSPHDEASFAARDLEDFTLKGTATIVRWLAQNVTFMNAGAQGLYKVGRSAADADRNVTAAVGGKVAWAATSRVAKVLAATTLATLALDYIYKDDEDYKKRSEYDRNSKFWFKFGDYQIQIPMGFEVAALSRMAANGLDAFFDPEMTGERWRQNALSIIGQNMFMDPIPTVASGLLDVATNTGGTGHAIEPRGMENLRPEARYTVNNTLASRGLSAAGNAVARTVGGPNAGFLSPIQLDYLWNAYTGWLGSFVLGAADRTARSFTSEPVRPEMEMWNWATGGIVSKGPTPQSRYVDMMYRQADATEKAYGTYVDLIHRQMPAEAQAFFEANRELIQKHGLVQGVVRAEASLNKQIRLIGNNPDPNMTAEQKRIAIMQLQSIRNRTAESVFGAR